jgi:hypothetical protein
MTTLWLKHIAATNWRLMKEKGTTSGQDQKSGDLLVFYNALRDLTGQQLSDI